MNDILDGKNMSEQQLDVSELKSQINFLKDEITFEESKTDDLELKNALNLLKTQVEEAKTIEQVKDLEQQFEKLKQKEIKNQRKVIQTDLASLEKGVVIKSKKEVTSENIKDFANVGRKEAANNVQNLLSEASKDGILGKIISYFS